MDSQIINYASTAVLFLVLGVFAIVSLMAAYVFIRYGRTRSITILISLILASLFGAGTLTAFLTLQRIF